MRGSAKLVGTTLVLPYNHVPHASLGSEHEDDMDEMMYGIPRDLAPYRQTVSGTNTLTIQTLETARSVRNQIDQLTAVADALDETYTLLNSLQATSQKMAEARPSPEYTRAVYRWRRWFTQYQEFLRKPHGTPWAFAGLSFPTFTIPTPHDETPSAPFTPGKTLSPRVGTSIYLSTAPYCHRVQDRLVFMYSLPRSHKTQLPDTIDEFPGAQELSNIYQLNEMAQHAAAMICEAIISGIPAFWRTDLPFTPNNTHH